MKAPTRPSCAGAWYRYVYSEMRPCTPDLTVMSLLQESAATATAVSPQAALLAGTDSDQEMTSPSAPTFSPMSDLEGMSESAESSSTSSSDGQCPGNEQPEAEESDTEPTSTEPSSTEPAILVAASDPPALSTPHSPGPDPGTTEWNGFKIVGDNLDKNIRPSLQRLTHQTKSLHHFHSYAVKDRVNFSAASDVSKSQPVDSSSFVMTTQDWR